MAIRANFNPAVQHLSDAVQHLNDALQELDLDLQDEIANHAQTRVRLNGVTQQLAQQQLVTAMAVQGTFQIMGQRDALQARLDELSNTCPVRAMNSLSRLKNRAINYLHDHKFAIAGIAFVIAAGLTDKYIKSIS